MHLRLLLSELAVHALPKAEHLPKTIQQQSMVVARLDLHKVQGIALQRLCISCCQRPFKSLGCLSQFFPLLFGHEFLGSWSVFQFNFSILSLKSKPFPLYSHRHNNPLHFSPYFYHFFVFVGFFALVASFLPIIPGNLLSSFYLGLNQFCNLNTCSRFI